MKKRWGKCGYGRYVYGLKRVTKIIIERSFNGGERKRVRMKIGFVVISCVLCLVSCEVLWEWGIVGFWDLRTRDLFIRGREKGWCGCGGFCFITPIRSKE